MPRTVTGWAMQVTVTTEADSVEEARVRMEEALDEAFGVGGWNPVEGPYIETQVEI